MFEYMMLGKPVIVSNFPLWEEIVRESGCGLTVNPIDIDEIVSAIQKIFQDDTLRKQMGQRGRKSVLEKYNWNLEEQRLLTCYRTLQ